MLKQHRWITVPSLLAGLVLAYAHVQGRASTETTTEVSKSSPTSATATALEKHLQGPEIWRLPAVAAPAMPAALVVPPAETLPAPAETIPPPAANAPLSLSGVLSGVLSGEKPLKVGPDPPEEPKLWSGSFNLGLDGSEGSSDTLNFRFGFHANRKHETNILTLNVDYNRSTAYAETTTNRLFFEGRFEWLLHDSRWSWFVHETIEYDEFQPFDVLDASDAGLGYRIIKNDATTFIGRFGGGFSHESGGPDNGEVVSELVFGLQLEHRISKRQKILGAVEYAPDVADFERYRIRTQAAWEVLLDEERNLSMRMGVLERYNGRSGTDHPNDLDYALMIMWKF